MRADAARVMRRTFRALRIRNYRLYFLSQAVSMSGAWMQSIAQSWLVLELTGNGVDLGITVGLQFGPVLFLGAWAGVLADRVDNRRLLVIMQSLGAVLALTLGLLAAADLATVWLIWLLAALTGCTMALDMPARQSFVYELAGPDDLANAVGLNAVVINASRITGPAIAGFIIAAVGVAPCFLINAGSFLVAIGALLMMRSAEFHASPKAPRERGQVRAGLSYAWRTRELRIPLLAMAIVSTLAYNFTVLVPLLAKDVFGRGGGGYAGLTTAMGVGALAGALFMASRGKPSWRLLVGSTLGFALATLALAAAPTYFFAAVILVPIGAGGVLFVSSTNALLQLNSEPSLRGRVMALWAMVFLGAAPIGGPLSGALARGFGVRAAIAVGGVATLATAVGSFAALRRCRDRAGCVETPVCLPDDPTPGDALAESVTVTSTATAAEEHDGHRPGGVSAADDPPPQVSATDSQPARLAP